MARKKSNFVKPIGDLKWEGPSRRELEEDDKRFERILSFVPDNKFLRPMVSAFFKRADEQRDRTERKLIEAEIKTAQDEIMRYWINVFILTWRMWSKMLGEAPDGLILDDSFLPDTEKCHGVPTKWEERLRKSEQSLRNAIALNDNDFNSVMQQFRDNIKKALQNGPVELPNDIDIVLDENSQPRLMARK